jgi:ABC-type nitrate/sulfonate/bicarbonate transport system permease component
VSQWLTDPAAWTDSVLPSVGRLLLGWSMAAGVGIGLGTIIGLSRRARAYVEPTIHFLRAIPPPALLPLFIVLLGIDDGMKVAMIAFGATWPILLNTGDAVASVDPLHRATSRVYRLGRRLELTRVILPSAAPGILAGLRISLSISVILMVISEMVATVDGIGFQLVQAQRSFRGVDVWSTILLLGLLGYGLNGVLGAIERRVLAGHRAPDAVRA